MVLVDTTVWVDLFTGAKTPQVDVLERLLADGTDICTTGVILTEVLQGIRNDAEYRRTAERFEVFLFLPMTRQTFVSTAALYRSLRKKGITVRKPIDCMIAAVAIEHDASLLHNDRDFDPIERHCDLQVVRSARRKPVKRRSRKDS